MGTILNAAQVESQQRWLYWHDIQERYNRSRVTIWRWIKKGYFPRPIKVGPNGGTNAWTPAMLAEFDSKHGQ